MRPHVPTITFFRGSGLRWQEEMAGQDRGATSKTMRWDTERRQESRATTRRTGEVAHFNI